MSFIDELFNEPCDCRAFLLEYNLKKEYLEQIDMSTSNDSTNFDNSSSTIFSEDDVNQSIAISEMDEGSQARDVKALLVTVCAKIDALDKKLDGFNTRLAEIFDIVNTSRMPSESPSTARKSIYDNLESEGSQSLLSSTEREEVEKPFVTFKSGDTVHKMFFPVNLQLKLRGARKLATIVSSILLHFHDVSFLRICCLTDRGSEKGDSSTHLPSLTIEAIIATSLMLLPLDTTFPPESSSYQMALKSYIRDIRRQISVTLNYFKQEYNQDGSYIPRKKKRSSTPSETS